MRVWETETVDMVEECDCEDRGLFGLTDGNAVVVDNSLEGTNLSEATCFASDP